MTFSPPLYIMQPTFPQSYAQLLQQGGLHVFRTTVRSVFSFNKMNANFFFLSPQKPTDSLFPHEKKSLFALKVNSALPALFSDPQYSMPGRKEATA